MAYFAERRKYQRLETAVCKAHMSIDGNKWSDIDLYDISAGGLKFNSSNKYETGTQMSLKLTVYNMLSEFNMKFEGHIVRVEKTDKKYEYSIMFDNINKYNQVQLDELIKSKVTIKNSFKPISEDGIYTFLFMPRIRPASFRSKMRLFK